jgi:hypothetical protein
VGWAAEVRDQCNFGDLVPLPELAARLSGWLVRPFAGVGGTAIRLVGALAALRAEGERRADSRHILVGEKSPAGDLQRRARYVPSLDQVSQLPARD